MRVFKCELCGDEVNIKSAGIKKTGCECGGTKKPLMEKTEPVAEVPCRVGLSLLPLDEDKLKSVIQGIVKAEQWEGGTLIEYAAMSTSIRKFHKWLCEQTEAKR